jgi:hypothetical protein
MRKLLVLLLALIGILAGGCIVRFGTLTNEGDRAHFVGLASNLTNADVVAASVQVDFLNSSGNVIATKNVSPCTRTLQKHEDSPIEASLPAGVTAKSVKTTVRPLTFGAKDEADLDVDEDDIEITTAADETHIKGTVDVGDDDLRDVHVCAALFDDDGDVIAVGDDNTSPSDINSDDSGTFDVTIDTSDIDIDDIDQFELWVDALTHSPSDVTAPVVFGPDDFSSAIQDTGLLSPGDAADVGDFATQDEALTSNDVYATAVTTAGAAKTHVFSDYPLDAADIPNSANIEGIGVRVDWKIDTIGNNSQIKVELSWDAGASWTAAKTSTELSTTEETVILGGSSEDWGRNWDVDELTDANFRVRITADSDVAKTFSFDWIPVTIYYTD